MYDGTGYEAPTLDDDEIQTSFQTGMLGEQVRHVTVDQLKSASPALVTQLCISILQKLDIDTDNIGQPYLQPELTNPEHYQNTTFMTIHIPLILSQLIPGCTHKVLCTADLLYPKWKKLRKFLSVTINYMRFLDNNPHASDVEEVMFKSEEIHHKVEEINIHNNKLETALQEANDYLVRNGEEHQKQIEDNVEVNKEMEELLKLKNKKGIEKEESKQNLEKTKEIIDKYSREIETLLQQRDKLKLQIVVSPEKQIAERETLAEKVNQAKDDLSRLQNEVSNGQWKIDEENETVTHLEYVEKKLADMETFFDNIKELQANLKKQQFQTETDSVSHALLSKQIEQLKQQIADTRETNHRNKLRSQKRIAAGKEQLEQLNKEKELVRSQAQDKGNKIESVIFETKEIINTKQNLETQHETTKQKLLNIETELKKCALETYTNTINQLNSAVDLRLKDEEKNFPNLSENSNS